jgi:hypothetical protein
MFHITRRYYQAHQSTYVIDAPNREEAIRAYKDWRNFPGIAVCLTEEEYVEDCLEDPDLKVRAADEKEIWKAKHPFAERTPFDDEEAA